MADPRLLVIMGSGETAPTMAKVHRTLFDRLGPGDVKAAIIDTPYGFQENADDLSARTVRFFAESLGREVGVASYRTREVDAITTATAVSLVRGARYVMAGPGSPSYALRHWAGGPVASALSDHLETGGVLTMASAAALTLGALTIPVYEIYKVGESPSWLPGLDLLAPSTGLKAAVVPHYDNAEGGNHDTRFCYIGERRLRELERQMPDGTFVLGVDGHTAVIFDLDRRTASVAGRGGVTVRAHGQSTIFPSGSEVKIETLADVAARLASRTPVDIGWEPAPVEPGIRSAAPNARPEGGLAVSGSTLGHSREPVQLTVADQEGAVVDALAHGDRRGAVAALLDLDLALEARVRSGEDSPDLDDARSTFHALIARLGGASSSPDPDLETPMDRLVDELLSARARARQSGDWDTADLIRAALARADVEVRDEASGWRRVLPGR
ncbi:MAG: hypothetical protein HYX54_05690 [Chloroflexi bacterium]|nr:hypothetical protein [Chloroflexota bacterium]